MVKHIVFWKLADMADGRTKKENALIIKRSLEELIDHIPEIIDMQVGINENGGEYDVCLVSTFESYDALHAYDSHPMHVKVRDFVGKVRLSRAAVDYTV